MSNALRNYEAAYRAAALDLSAIELRPVIVKRAPVVAANVEPGRCCERAIRRPCVCVASWSCPAHGDTCIGSHD